MRDKLRRLERLAVGNAVSIPQPDGPPAVFPESALKDAYINLCDRMGAGDGAPPEHPLMEAARNSSAPKWSGSFYATDGATTGPIEELFE
jgi:hypothetical protein